MMIDYYFSICLLGVFLEELEMTANCVFMYFGGGVQVVELAL
jgi:hypothetical protein